MAKVLETEIKTMNKHEIEKLMRALSHKYKVPVENCRKAALALIYDVVDACELLEIDPNPEIKRFVKAYTHPVYVRIIKNCGKYEIPLGTFSTISQASQEDTYRYDHIHHVVRDKESSIKVLIFEDEYEEEIFPRISCHVVNSNENINTDEEETTVVIKGLKIVPSMRQLNGMHPIDPRFYIK